MTTTLNTPAPAAARAPIGDRLRAAMPAVFLVAPLLVFLLAFYVVPFGVMLEESFGAWSNDPPEVQESVPTLYQYIKTVESGRTVRALWRTFEIALLTVVFTLLLSYPVALLMLRLGPRLRTAILMITFISLASSLIVRNYGWLVVLADQGPVNNIMVALGIFDRPQRLVYNEGAIIVALVHYCMPFMILPIYGALVRIPASQWEAARALGASSFTTLRTVVLPLSMPGIFGGTTLCFAISASAFVTPLMLGSPGTAMASQVAAEQLLTQLNFPWGSAIIFVLTGATFTLVFLYALIVKRMFRVDV